MICRYCYQTSRDEHSCSDMSHCNSAANPVQRYRSNCTTKSHVLCLGRRSFLKNIRCNWTAGYRWSTTLFLSVTLGGFGADRFYLGHWQEGIGKLFSFGGAGVWTLIDVILVAIGYLKPADGSIISIQILSLLFSNQLVNKRFQFVIIEDSHERRFHFTAFDGNDRWNGCHVKFFSQFGDIVDVNFGQMKLVQIFRG